MLGVFKDFAEKLSRIGKYYGVESADSESEAAFLYYTEKKRVVSNLRRTLILAMFLTLYLVLVIISVPFKLFHIDSMMLVLLVAGTVSLAAFIGISIIIYDKVNANNYNLTPKERVRIQFLYTFFWSLYYAILISCEFIFTDWVIGTVVWMPIMIVGLLVPVFSLQEGVVP
ncbi:MAG: hypothetical protein Q4F70_03295, partial [Clostridia bacterium]|nr:hypothetical protein [Clostridia bacterium]